MGWLDWEQIKKDYPIGRIIDATISRVWELGIRVELDGLGPIGIVRNQEMSWEETINNVKEFNYRGELLSPGRELRLAILRVDPRNRQIILSLRRAERDPWDFQEDRYQVGKRVRGQVTLITKNHALVEFKDHVTGRLPKDEIVPWLIKSIDDILIMGDTVEVIVKGRDEVAREITVSMKENYEKISAELASTVGNEPHWLSEIPETSGSVTTAIDEPAPGVLPVRRPIEQILIIDDLEDACIQLKSILEDLGYINVEYVASFEAGVHQAITRNYDLILMDLKENDNQWMGIQAAENIQAVKPKALIVLVTAEDGFQNTISDRYYISGRIPKPFSHEDVDASMKSLEKTGHAGWPVALKETEKESVRFVHDISQVAKSHKPLFDVLVLLLDKVVHATGAARAAVFSMNLRSFHVEMPAYISLAPDAIAPYRGRLARSPVSDTILRREHLFENDVPRHEGKYRNLLKVEDFNGCIGIPIEVVEEGDVGYALFLLRHDENPFTEAALVLAEAAASMIAQAIREDWLVNQLATGQRINMIGTAITSIGHELKGRLSALEAINKLKTAWEQLKKDSNRCSDPQLRAEIDENLARLASARTSMEELTDVLAGTVRLTQDQVVDLGKALKSAIDMVSYQAAKAKITLDVRIFGLPTLVANRLELEQVFMNLLLNAIQQMPHSHRPRGRISIETSYEPADKEFPIKIRFTDSGPGIHHNYLEKIFEPMYTTKNKGTGMGLYICRDLLGKIKAELRVENTAVLVGTTFLVALRKG